MSSTTPSIRSIPWGSSHFGPASSSVLNVTETSLPPRGHHSVHGSEKLSGGAYCVVSPLAVPSTGTCSGFDHCRPSSRTFCRAAFTTASNQPRTSHHTTSLAAASERGSSSGRSEARILQTVLARIRVLSSSSRRVEPEARGPSNRCERAGSSEAGIDHRVGVRTAWRVASAI